MPIKRFIVNFYGCSEDKSGTITLLQKNCLSGCRIQSKPDFIRQRFSEVFQQPCQMAFVAEMLDKGEVAPLEYCETKIKDIIISARKQNLVMELERELLDEALESGKFVIY